MSRIGYEEISQRQKCDARDDTPKTIREWIDYFQKNKPQVNSLVVGIMLLVYGGQNLGWGIFNDHLRVQPWAGGYADDGEVFWTIISWFIANIVGLFIGFMIISRFTKIKIYVFCSILSSISATCFITHPASITIIIPGRIIAGISHGIVYLTMLVHASEVAIPKLRGYTISIVNFSIMIGVFSTSKSIAKVYKTRSYEDGYDPTKTLGYNGLICIMSGLLLALFFHRESPIYLIKKYDEKQALQTLKSLRSELHETLSIRQEFDELLQAVKEDSKSTMNMLKYSYPFTLVLFLKTIFVCSFNMPLNIYFLELAKIHFFDGIVDNTGNYLIGTRLTVMLISIFLIDFKRIKMFLLSSIGCAGILILISICSISDVSIYSVILPIAFQTVAGIAIGNISDIYSVDTVNTKFKPCFLWLSSAYETLLQIILTVIYFYTKISIFTLFAIFGILMTFGLLAIPCNTKIDILPDTSGLSLRLARNLFKNK